MWLYFSNTCKVSGSNFIKQHSETVTVWNCQNAYCGSLKNKFIVLAPLKLRPYGAIQICLLLLLLLLLFIYYNFRHTSVRCSCVIMIHRRPCVWSADATPACHRRPPSDTTACDVCVCRHNGGDYVELPTDDMIWWLRCHNGRCCWRETHAGAGNEPENRFPLCRPISPVYTVAAALLAVGLLVKNIAAVIAVISGICFIVCQYRVAFTVVIIVQCICMR